jgi:CRISPR system Cascade subunit CasD
MTSFLLFQLYGPLASWGDVAVGERRPSFSTPSKSAVLGLVGAAIGVRRDDADRLAQLHQGYGFAVRVDAPGKLLTDYHTVQVPGASVLKGKQVQTRRDELLLADGALNTVLSQREYLCDAVSVACVWALGPEAPWSAETLAGALRRPVFTPSLGRKSCPPGLPFHPQVVEATHPVEALKQANLPRVNGLRLAPAGERRYHWEGAVNDPHAGRALTRSRRDQARSRARWQFVDRDEHVATEEALSHVPDPR